MRQRLAVEQPPGYIGTRDNFSWIDHAARTLITGAAIAWLAPQTILDPACGDASILSVAYKLRPFQFAFLSDISERQINVISPTFPCSKQAGDLIATLSGTGTVNCVVLTEILEHMPDPDHVLRLARHRGEALVASSPIGDPEDGHNPEHLWAWDEAGYQEMLETAGWTVVLHTNVIIPGVNGNAQIWVCR